MRPLGHWLLLFSLVAMWGSSYAATAVALETLSPAAIVAGRLVIAAAVLLAYLWLSGRRLPTERRLWAWFALMALVGTILPFLAIAWGQKIIPSGVAGILMAVMPLFTLILAHFFVGEPLTRQRVAGFVIGFAGMVVLVGPNALLAFDGAGLPLLAQLAVLFGALCYGANAILARLRPPTDATPAAVGVCVCGSVVMTPVAALEAPFTLSAVSWPSAAAVAALGLIATAVAIVVYFRLIAAAGPSFLSLINYLIPLWAVAVGALALGERPPLTAFIALVLVLSGIAISERGRPRSEAET